MKKAWTKVGHLFGRETSKNVGSSPNRADTARGKTQPRNDRGDVELDTISLADLLIGATPTKHPRHSPPKCLEQQQAALLATFDTSRPPTPTSAAPTRLLPAGAKPGPPPAAPLMQRVGAVEEKERADEVTPKGYQSNPLFDAPPKPSLVVRVEEAHQQALLEQWEQHQAELAAAEKRLQQLLAQAEANWQAQMGAAQQKLAKRLLTQMAPVAKEEAYKHKVRELQRKIAGDAHRFERAAREQAGQVAYLQSKLRELSRELQDAKRVTEITLAAAAGAGAGAGSNPNSPLGKPHRQLSLGAGSFTGRLSRQPSFAGGSPAARLLPPQQPSGFGPGGCPSPTGRLSHQSSLGGSPVTKLPPSPFGGGTLGPAGSAGAGSGARSAQQQQQQQMLVSDLPAKLARASEASNGSAGSSERGGKAAQPPRFDIHVTAGTIAAGRMATVGPQAGSSGNGKAALPAVPGGPGQGPGALSPGTATDSKAQAKGQQREAVNALREEGAWELLAGRVQRVV